MLRQVENSMTARTHTRTPAGTLSNEPAHRVLALRQYQWRAGVYDSELAWFEPLRIEAIASLGLLPGQRVIDVGCGTGLSFEPLMERVGNRGHIVGIEQCPQMLDQARQRIRRHGWKAIELVSASADQAPVQGQADAALFHFTHDIVRTPAAIENVMNHLKPGARIAATGLQWAHPLAWPVNLFVWSAALYSATTLDGLDNPWSCLARYIPGLQVRPTWMGGVSMATGVWPGAMPAGR